MSVIAYLQGGIGNRLFEIAASIGAAEFYGNDWRVQSDFDHKNFSIHPQKLIDSYALPRYTEPRFDYYVIPEGNWQLWGYFQSEKYFRHCSNLIRKSFAAPHKLEQKIKWKYKSILEKETCAIHVRRGDYIKLKDYHYNLEADYYFNAIRAMQGLHFVCFSDDIPWCKENIPANDYIQDEAMIEFHLMSYCKNFIIANSTFSWWASYLSDNADKTIIAPPRERWFGEKNRAKNVSDLYCPNWNVLTPKHIAA